MFLQLFVFLGACLRPIERAPVSAPLAATLAARLAPYMFHGADAADEQAKQLAKARFVERAADAPRCRAERDRSRNVEQ